ncbi:hypothetical protein NPIL_526121 [Nephila pilipes]|uniref:Uncharacterized protein n=1 Tax=Nephila pilipes TaxID=299642 RepID=A0A8X6PYC8_NEPPI|nr:hypothetical protein NPIL_526121 [Nephila pilipes]
MRNEWLASAINHKSGELQGHTYGRNIGNHRKGKGDRFLPSLENMSRAALFYLLTAPFRELFRGSLETRPRGQEALNRWSA